MKVSMGNNQYIDSAIYSLTVQLGEEALAGNWQTVATIATNLGEPAPDIATYYLGLAIPHLAPAAATRRRHQLRAWRLRRPEQESIHRTEGTRA
jgi:hypothetical protein